MLGEGLKALGDLLADNNLSLDVGALVIGLAYPRLREQQVDQGEGGEGGYRLPVCHDVPG